MIYAVNLLTRSENGKFQYYMGYLPLVLSVAEFGLPSAVVKYLSASIDDKRAISEILTATVIIKLLIIIFLFLVSIFVYYNTGEDYISIYITTLGGIIMSFVSYFESIFVSFRFYISLAIWNPLTNIIRLVSLYCINHLVETPLGYIDILSIFTLTPIFILVFFFIIFPKSKLYWSGIQISKLKSIIKQITIFNFWAFLASIFAITSDRLEIFMIKTYHSSNDVAIYGTALQLFSGFVILFSTLNSLVLPKLSSLMENTEEFKKVLIKSVMVGLSFALLLSPGFFLAEPILNFLFDSKYQESIPVFKILYPNYLLQLVFAPLGIALFAMGKPKILAILALLRLIFGYILDTQLIPEFGVMGAGASFFLGQIISWLILLGYFWASFWR
jgi:O-antigen/teichoic acid export membrane protein